MIRQTCQASSEPNFLEVKIITRMTRSKPSSVNTLSKHLYKRIWLLVRTWLELAPGAQLLACDLVYAIVLSGPFDVSSTIAVCQCETADFRSGAEYTARSAFAGKVVTRFIAESPFEPASFSTKRPIAAKSKTFRPVPSCRNILQSSRLSIDTNCQPVDTGIVNYVRRKALGDRES